MLGSGLDDGGFAADIVDALLELMQLGDYQCIQYDGACPELYTEEFYLWRCKKLAGSSIQASA